jgi:hypothetical protein
MKTTLILLGLILLLFSCNKANHNDSVTNTTDEQIEIGSENSVMYDPYGALWKYDYNQQTDEFELIQLRSVDRDTLTGKALENIINTSWPRVNIAFLRTSNDTAYLSIPYSEVLTQQMGSAGAESFMISTTYSLTELKGINYVSFHFAEGDHAIPGVYSRNSWK